MEESIGSCFDNQGESQPWSTVIVIFRPNCKHYSFFQDDGFSQFWSQLAKLSVLFYFILPKLTIIQDGILLYEAGPSWND
jgi:hypothetical protein